MSPSDIQKELMTRHGMRVPQTDPAFLVASINELMLADAAGRVEAAASRAEGAAARIEAVKAPLPDKDLRRLEDAALAGAANGAQRQVMALAKAANWRTILIGAGMLFIAAAVGAAGGYWLRGSAPVFAGVRAGVDKCADQDDGSRVCWIPIFERLPAAR
jgi:hypothetical protein